jgi:hypothetical protein
MVVRIVHGLLKESSFPYFSGKRKPAFVQNILNTSMCRLLG